MIEKHTFPTQQIVNGELVCPPSEICLTAAGRVFRERQIEDDTNPKIVQMILNGKLIEHWYYRSDQWIEQPYLKMSEFLQPYIGPVDGAMPFLYGNGTYVIDEDATEIFSKRSK